jgi:prevent-host-death family protein
MPVATTRYEVGVRELKNNLSRYVDRVSHGDEVVVTEHGRPVARLLRVDEPTDRLHELIVAGLVRPPKTITRRLPKAIKAAGPVSDLVADQRR